MIKSRIMRLAGHVERIVERRSAYRVLVRKPEGKRQLRIPRHRWEDNMKMDLQEVGCGGYGLDRPRSDRDKWWALVNTVMKRWSHKMRGIS
jgi:hypothetical protein